MLKQGFKETFERKRDNSVHNFLRTREKMGLKLTVSLKEDWEIFHIDIEGRKRSCG